MAKRTIIITGGGGFVGKYLVKELVAEDVGFRIIVWDREVKDVPKGVEGLEMDITRAETYRDSLQEKRPDWVIHLAAVSDVGMSFKDPELTRKVNVEGARGLLEEVEKLGGKTRVLVVSSSDIYGSSDGTPLPELPLGEARPKSPYARSKWEMEQIIEERFKEMVVRVRPFPHIGPGQSRGFVTADFAAQIAAIERGEQEPVIKVGNLEARRDFTDVRDVVRAYRLLLQSGKPGEVYNVASGRAVSIQLILDKLLEMSKVKISVEQDEELMRPVEVPVLVGDASKLKKETGNAWEPKITLEQTLADILNYWRSLNKE